MLTTPIRIGFCTDLSGPYQAVDGPAGADAIRMAIEDMGPTVADRRVELLLGDHHNDEQEAATIAQRWYASGVDVVISGVNSDTSLAMTAVAAGLGKPILVVGAGTSVQTREHAAPCIIQYAYDTLALATVPGLVLARQGMQRWFFITADYVFGRQLEEHGKAAIKAAGGTVVGSVKNPQGAANFTPFLEAARDSRVDVLALANGHAELREAMAAIETMELRLGMKLVALLTFIDDIHDMGLQQAQGVYLADSWFWTRDAQARQWARRFYARQQRMPSSLQAANYSAATQYLKSVTAVGNTESQSILQHLRNATLNDMYVKNGRIREDGMMIHDMHLLQVKSPQQSTEAWDYYNLIDTVNGNQAFPLR